MIINGYKVKNVGFIKGLMARRDQIIAKEETHNALDAHSRSGFVSGDPLGTRLRRSVEADDDTLDFLAVLNGDL